MFGASLSRRALLDLLKKNSAPLPPRRATVKTVVSLAAGGLADAFGLGSDFETVPRFSGTISPFELLAIDEPKNIDEIRETKDGYISWVYVGGTLAAKMGGQISASEVSLIAAASGLASVGAEVHVRSRACPKVNRDFKIIRTQLIPGDQPPRNAFDTEFFRDRAIQTAVSEPLEKVLDLLSHLAYHGEISARSLILAYTRERYPEMMDAIQVAAETPIRSETWSHIVHFELHHGVGEIRVSGNRYWVLFQACSRFVPISELIEQLREHQINVPQSATAFCARAPNGIRPWLCAQFCLANDVIAFV